MHSLYVFNDLILLIYAWLRSPLILGCVEWHGGSRVGQMAEALRLQGGKLASGEGRILLAT